MTSTKFLKFAIPALLLPAGVAILLPSTMGSWYAKVVQPAAMLFSSLLSLWVARMYTHDLRRSFLFLFLFLFLYGLVNITPLVERLHELLGSAFITSVVAYQVATYVMLILACVFILRAVKVTRIHPGGWLAAGVALVVGAGIVGYAIPTTRDIVAVDAVIGIQYLLIRVFDVLVMLMLAPVLWLYVQNAKSKYKESATFSIVLLGIIASLELVYLYEAALQKPIAEIAATEFQKGSFLDAVYIFGYLLVAVGLYTHRKHQEWSLHALDAVLAGDMHADKPTGN